MRICRAEVNKFRSACGLRNPAYDEVEALIEEIDAFAALTRIPDAMAPMPAFCAFSLRTGIAFSRHASRMPPASNPSTKESREIGSDLGHFGQAA